MSSTLIADAERARKRMAICQSCPFAVGGNTKKYICSKCGCVLAGKTRLSGESCPEGKW